MISKISLTLEFTSKDPEAEVVKFLGERIMSAVNAPQAKVTVNAVSTDSVAVTEPVKAEAPKSKGRPAGAKNKPKVVPTVANGLVKNNTEAKPVEVPVVTVDTSDYTSVTDVPPVLPDPQPVQPPVSQEQAQEALSRVFAKFGMESAMQLLQEHGARRVSDLKPEDRPAFVKAADLKANS